MDISSSDVKLVLGNVDSFRGLQPSANQEHIPSISIADYLVNELVSAVDESLNIKGSGEESLNVKDVGKEWSDIEDVGKESSDIGNQGQESIDIKDVSKESVDIKDSGEMEHVSYGDNVSGMEKRKSCKGPNAQQGEVTRKCLNKCATFPIHNGVLPASTSSDMEDQDPETALRLLPGGEEHLHQACSRSVSLPAPLKLLPAIKGSREKEGLSPGKLTVTWAPDVYDPPTTSMSHTVTGKKQQKSKNKKNWKRDGKKGQKGSSSRGKEKKQGRRSGTSDRYNRSLDAREDFGELVVGCPDQHSHCGSSFLRNSLSSLHYPVAEAL